MDTYVAKNGKNWERNIEGERTPDEYAKHLLVNEIDKQKEKLKSGRLPKQKFDAWGTDRRCIQGYPQVEYKKD